MRWWYSTESRCFRIMHSGTSSWTGLIRTSKVCKLLAHSLNIRNSILMGDKFQKTRIFFRSVYSTQTMTPQFRGHSRPWTPSHPSQSRSSNRKSKSLTHPSKCPRHLEKEGSHRLWSPRSRVKILNRLIILRWWVRSTNYIVWCTLAWCILRCSFRCHIRRSCWIMSNSN